MELDPEVAKHSRHYGGGVVGGEGRILGLLECAERERERGAPVSQEEEEAGWTPTLLNTQQYKNTATLQGEKATQSIYT